MPATAWRAPFCSTLFAEFRAEVINVEAPRTGESNRNSVSFEQGECLSRWTPRVSVSR